MTEKKITMMTYIREEQSVLGEIVRNYRENTKPIRGTEWLILATGSSINAAYSAKYYIESICDVYISIEEPFKFEYYEKLRPTVDVVIGVSQSGESTSTIEALKHIRNESSDIHLMALTNNMNSEIVKVVDEVIEMQSGEEKIGYVTKGFSVTILKLMLLGLRTAAEKNQITVEKENKELLDFSSAIKSIDNIINKTEIFFNEWRTELVKASRYTTLCCGSAIGTAFEMQTKFSETVRIPSQGMDIEVFMHGPYFEVNKGHQLFYIETNSPVNDRLLRLKEYEKKYVNNYFTITLNESTDKRTIGLNLNVDEFKAPLFTIIPFQVLAHHIAEDLGNDLAKRIFTDFGVEMRSKTKPGDYI
ncbi:SIS domain-containing protein [Dellaglioa carnosa]|uniref:SIS domain-containing protein n=1 Tax=Dellaglioa carnosa TaxID=2995136 RepID=UPI0022A85035|nr:SIS domain-containing protein [Dellaglioa carnosa]MCZ2492857.1 SIS domain-containing protein [Dellaglioa carnosa]